MNIEHIKALADILTAGGLTSIEVTEGETKIKLKKTAEKVTVQASAPATVAVVQESITVAEDAEPVNFKDMTEVKAPLVGVFYSSPSPDSPPFVSIGSKVKKGDVLCIVEAMKLMNEITAEQDGEIADIAVKNGDIVEYGQVMFKII